MHLRRSCQSIYNYFRDYDPAIARYVESDPIGLEGGVNTYQYARSLPTVFVDFLGLIPGDPFTSKGAAAQDALNYINPISIKENQEYFGIIYHDPSTCLFYATNPTPSGCQGGRRLSGKYPAGMTAVGDYHTHGDYSDPRCRRTTRRNDAFGGDHFSTPDLADAHTQARARPGWTKYLGTPSGAYLELTYPGRPGPLVP
ncbi:MAG TPA: RHS repeat-associated core domain-containing protein [Pyrinomonadaceae bacterium]